MKRQDLKLLKIVYKLLDLSLESSIQNAEIYIKNAMNIIQIVLRENNKNNTIKQSKKTKTFLETFTEATIDP